MRRSMRRIAHALLLFALLIVTLAVMGNPASARMVEDEAVSLQPAGALASAGPGAVLPEPAGLKQSSELVASELTSITWLGQGSEHNCANGGNLHWILTTGGNADIVSGTLYVTFAPIPPSETPETLSFQGEFMGGNRGAMHFYSDYPARVLSAYADYTYTGTQQGIPRLVISHSTCNTTTTTASTTTTTASTTTTTASTTTTTTEPTTTTTTEPTTTTTASTTTTTTEPTTTTTASTTTTTEPTTTTTEPTTTTTASTTTTTTEPTTTTTASTTTTTEPTTTTTASTTTTTEPTTTTAVTVSPITTNPVTTATTIEPGSTTISTAGHIQTGGGGTANPAESVKTTLLLVLAGIVLAGAGFAVYPRLRPRRTNGR